MVKSKKMNKSTIAIIVLSLLLVVSLVLSATGAWFTDWQNDNKDTPVTFGRVNVDAGEITYSAAGEVLTNFIPGDTLEVSLTINDDSTVDTYIYVNTEMYLKTSSAVYKAVKLTLEQYDAVKGLSGALLATAITNASIEIPTSSDVFLKDANVTIVNNGSTASATEAWTVLDTTYAKNTYLIDREDRDLDTKKDLDKVTVSYDVEFAEDTINYVLFEEMKLDTDSGAYVVSEQANRFSVVELNGLVGYNVLSTLQVRAIQAQYFDDAQTPAQIEAYLKAIANFSRDGQKYTAI